MDRCGGINAGAATTDRAATRRGNNVLRHVRPAVSKGMRDDKPVAGSTKTAKSYIDDDDVVHIVSAPQFPCWSLHMGHDVWPCGTMHSCPVCIHGK